MSDETNTEPTGNAARKQPGDAPSSAPRKPEFGELAPEGWVNPVTGEPAGGSVEGSAEPSQTAAGARAPSPDLAGVPRNLGKGVSRKPDGSSASAAVAPDRPAEPAASSVTPNDSKGTAAGSTRQIPAASVRIDRVATIVLLAAGAIGSLNMADSFMQLTPLFAQLYALFGLGEFTAPAWFAIVSTIGWVSQLLIWALTLLLSIQRMRRQKLAFFIPIAGAVLSFIVAIVLMGVAISAAPDLITYLSTNGFSIEQLQELQ